MYGFNYNDGSYTPEERAHMVTADQLIHIGMKNSTTKEDFVELSDAADIIYKTTLNARYERLAAERRANRPLWKKLLNK